MTISCLQCVDCYTALLLLLAFVSTDPLRKYVHVFFIVSGVALFLGGGTNNKKTNTNGGDSNEDVVTTGVYLQIIGVAMLTISLCFDGGLSAYEDKLVTTLSLTTFDLMYNIHLANAMICGASLVFLNELSMVADLIHGRGLQLLAIGLLGALGQVRLQGYMVLNYLYIQRYDKAGLVCVVAVSISLTQSPILFLVLLAC